MKVANVVNLIFSLGNVVIYDVVDYNLYLYILFSSSGEFFIALHWQHIILLPCISILCHITFYFI